ncbi:MAG: DUF3256 family protein [Tannerella sp.]|jgi:hypothetical protein|nr:DUF3256 family protein [Tannerella sp.]
MRRYITGLIASCLLVVANAQKMEDVFIQMPNELIVQLEEAWRKDLVDLYKSGKPAVLENSMLGKSVLKKLTDDYLLLQSTERSMVELRLLPLVNNTRIICMIQTIFGPVADSRVSFYSSEWQPLPVDGIFTPVNEKWFWKEDAVQTAFEFLSCSDLFLVKYSLSDEKETLTAEYMTPHYLDDENQQIVKPLLKSDPKTYEWKSGRFE